MRLSSFKQKSQVKNVMLQKIATWIFIFAGLWSVAQAENPATEAQNQSLEAIHQTVLEYIKQKADQEITNPEFKIRPLSNRLILPQCQTELSIEDRSPNSRVGKMTIGVACTQPNWKVYIPAEINGLTPLVYTQNAILKGQTIQPQDLRVELVPYNQIPPNSVIKIESIVGMRTKRAITANSVIKVQYIQPPYIVFKNHQVNILTRIGEIEVKSFGVALQNAVEGEQIEVQNQSSQKIIKGIVIAPNTILVP